MDPAEFLRRMAPTQPNDDRRRFIAAAELLEYDEARDTVEGRAEQMFNDLERHFA